MRLPTAEKDPYLPSSFPTLSAASSCLHRSKRQRCDAAIAANQCRAGRRARRSLSPEAIFVTNDRGTIRIYRTNISKTSYTIPTRRHAVSSQAKRREDGSDKSNGAAVVCHKYCLGDKVNAAAPTTLRGIAFAAIARRKRRRFDR